jgi:hypothetical protein
MRLAVIGAGQLRREVAGVRHVGIGRRSPESAVGPRLQQPRAQAA